MSQGIARAVLFLLDLILGRGKPGIPPREPLLNRADDPYFRAFVGRCMRLVYGPPSPLGRSAADGPDDG